MRGKRAKQIRSIASKLKMNPAGYRSVKRMYSQGSVSVNELERIDKAGIGSAVRLASA
jgi:hypothetical protein